MGLFDKKGKKESEKLTPDMAGYRPEKEWWPDLTDYRKAMLLLLSTRDTKNPFGDSCVGIYADRDFYFGLSGDFFEWGPVPTSGFNYAGYLQAAFGFDTQWIPNTSQCKWERCRLTLTCEE